MKGIRQVLLLAAAAAAADVSGTRQLVADFSDRLCALSQPAVAERARSLPLLLTHMLLHAHALPYIKLVCPCTGFLFC